MLGTIFAHIFLLDIVVLLATIIVILISVFIGMLTCSDIVDRIIDVCTGIEMLCVAILLAFVIFAIVLWYVQNCGK